MYHLFLLLGVNILSEYFPYALQMLFKLKRLSVLVTDQVHLQIISRGAYHPIFNLVSVLWFLDAIGVNQYINQPGKRLMQ